MKKYAKVKAVAARKRPSLRPGEPDNAGSPATLHGTVSQMRQERDEALATIQAIPIPYVILLADLRVKSANEIFYRDFKTVPADTEGHSIYKLGDGEWDLPEMHALLEEILPSAHDVNGYKITHTFTRFGRRTLLLNARQVDGPQGAGKRIVLAILDDTARQQAEESLREDTQRMASIFEGITDAFYTLDLEWRFTFLNPKAEEVLVPLNTSGKGILGQTIWEVFPDAVGTLLEENFRRARTTHRSVNFPIFYPALKAWFEIRAYPFKDGLSVYFQNISARTHAEKALRTSEEQLRAIYDGTDEYLGLLLPDGTLLEANSASLRFGAASRGPINRSDVVGLPLWETDWFRHTPGAPEVVRHAITQAASGEYVRWLAPLRAPDGTEMTLDISLAPIRDKNGAVVFIVPKGRDVTQRQRTEDALRENEERFRTLADNIAQLAWMADPDGALFWYNKRWFDYTGTNFQVMQGWGWQKVHHPDHLDRVVRKWQEHLRRGETWEDTFPLRGADGQYRWFLSRALPIRDENGKVQRWFGTNTDVTEVREAQEALRESKVRLDFTLESAQVGDWDLDLTTNKMYRSARHDRIFGYVEPLAHWSYEIFLSHVHPDDRAEVDTRFKESLAQLKEWHFECRVFWPDGSMHWIEGHGGIYRSDNRIPLNMLGIVNDITDRKTADQVLLNALEEVRRASRTKDEFLAALSHELRTPLTPALLAAANLRHSDELSTDAREQLGMIERNIALEARLIDDLLDLTKVARGKLELRTQAFDAHGLINLAIEMVRSEADAKEISIDRIFTATHSTLVADPARFQQVIWNLLRNAVKFTPSRGKTVIRTDEETRASGERWLRIEVSDSGIGIDPSRAGEIFLPFDRGGLEGDHRFGGLGLGLAIARAVVELHGGSISVHSEGPNRGATFIVWLPGLVDSMSPFVDGSASVITAASLPSSPRRTIGAAPVTLRLLLVEDHKSTLKALSQVLAADGHHIVPAESVAQALAAAAQATFDLVISDLGLPDGTGTDLMEKLRSAYGLRGLALSGYGMEEDVARSRKAGFVAHLVKPIHIAELRKALASISQAER